jgi:RimJ/RimL family protein N-acetyltransferase
MNGRFSIHRNSIDGADMNYLFVNFIQAFDLQNKRIDNFKKADSSIYALNDKGDLVGIIYVVKKFKLVNNVTWLVSPKYRNQGIASKLIAEAQGQFRLLTAFARNDASYRLAKKMHFFVFFKKFCIWLNFKARIPSTNN